MKSLCFYENPQELETLKERVASGEVIYTVIDSKTVLLNADNTANLASKEEFNSFIRLFSFEPQELDNQAASETGTKDERLDKIERRIDDIETALKKPILF